MNLLSKEFDLSFLSSRFADMGFQLFVSDDPISYISCIACSCEESSKVVGSWRAIQNYVSGFYQPVGELAIWNVYLAFFCVEKLPLWEKYEIENDKYAVRKLVLDGQKALPDTYQAIARLSRHLLGTDLVLDKSTVELGRDISLPLEKYVRGAPLDSQVKSREVRAQMINNIIEFLEDNENQKS
ncbi:hypothetical protein LCH33_005101 [Pseudomonas amygdali]|jgi:hypothetical protein|uniref:ABC-three component system middle component 1 n=1 Tax=Pseudomonas syringae group TaxID=136849 RepID=UPI000EFF1FD9|nr:MULTISPECIES: ABC-three component system middle component 1 [Pseudomonas syringae group]MCH5514101.1 hypothetical protein [Pseudomonas syringae pv. syringae]MCH5628073.1 hypothetical protein [Pseudomonas syringae pv. syringae]UBT81647.1 hypothetical protein LCH33_005101 [Pseudomonas amygdali]